MGGTAGRPRTMDVRPISVFGLTSMALLPRLFQSSAGNPFLDEIEASLFQLGRIRRHVRLVLVRHQQKESAAIGIAGLDDRSGAAAFHHIAEGVQGQAAAFLVGSVTGEAVFAQEAAECVPGRWSEQKKKKIHHRGTENTEKRQKQRRKKKEHQENGGTPCFSSL